jgi:ABC-type nitrate/sulfonate/bicarbonate transport system substrate-binding protein
MGMFAKHGINVTFPRLELGGPQSIAGLLRGDWDFVQTGTIPVAEAVLKGGDAVVLLRDSELQDNIVIMTRDTITNLAELTGKTVGVLSDTWSGQTGVIARLAIERARAGANYVGLGTYQNIYSALMSGEIDAGALPVDFQFLLQKEDRWNFFEASSMHVPAIFATTRRTIDSNRELVLRVLRGFIETVHKFKTQPDNVVPLLQAFLGYRDRSAVEHLQRYYASVLAVVPRPRLSEGMQGLRDLFSPRYPAASKLRESAIVDGSLINELECAGFIAQTYSNRLPEIDRAPHW